MYYSQVSSSGQVISVPFFSLVFFFHNCASSVHFAHTPDVSVFMRHFATELFGCAPHRSHETFFILRMFC